MPFRSTRIAKPGPHVSATPAGIVLLTHDQRHIRRKLLHTIRGMGYVLEARDEDADLE